MGLYNEVLHRKQKRDSELEASAFFALKRNIHNTYTDNLFDEIQTVLKFYLNQLGLSAESVKGCTTIPEILDCMLSPLEVIYDSVRLTSKFIRSNRNTLLVFTKNNKPVLIQPKLIGYKFKDIDQEWWNIRLNLDDYKEDAFILYPPIENDGFSVWKFICTMLGMVSYKDIINVIAATCMVSILGLFGPMISKIVLNQLIPKGSAAFSQLLMFFFAYVLAGVFKGIFSVIKTLCLSDTKLRISEHMQSRIMSRILYMPYEYFENKRIGKLSAQISNGKKLSDIIIDFFLNNLLGTVFALIYIPQMRRMSPKLVVPSLLILLIQIIVSVVLAFCSMQNTRNVIALEQDADGMNYELLNGIQKIQGMGAQKRAFARTADVYQRYLNASQNPPLLTKLNSVILENISSFGTLIILLLTVPAGVGREDYLAYTASFGILASSVSSIVSMARATINAQPIIEQLRQLFEYKKVSEKNTIYVRNIKGDIKIQDLSFSYGEGTKNCISQLNMHIHPGEKVAIVGESGCGKSTLLKLLLGILTPSEGQIIYDNNPISTFYKRSLRKQIGSVFQFSMLFPGTFRENISYLSGDIEEEKIWEACRKAAIEDYIRSLPMGLDTEITEGNGGGLSGGQKQRLLLARVFAQNPNLMILDEATSALDNKTQAAVLKSIYETKATVIMVAQRLSTVVDCDRIFVFKDGCICESGTYHELLAMNGVFTELVNKQMTHSDT